MTRKYLFALFLLVVSVNLLTGAGRLNHSDCEPLLSASRSLVAHGWFDVGSCTYNTLYCFPGPDGKNYSAYGIVPSVLSVPAVALSTVAARVLHRSPDLIVGLFASLWDAVVAATLPVLFSWWILRLGYSYRIALVCSLLLAFGTPIWFYGTKGFYSEPCFLLGLLFCVICLFEATSGAGTASVPNRFGTVPGLLFAALGWGIACGTRINGIIFLPLLLLYLFLRMRDQRLPRQAIIRNLLIFLTAAFTALIVIGLVNDIRYGSPLKTGYQFYAPSTFAMMNVPLFTGIIGLLFDGTVGLVWFAPFVLLLFVAARPFWHRHRPEAVLCATLSALALLFYAKLSFWDGGHAYGPRYLSQTLPFLILPLTVLLARFEQGKRERQGLYAVTVAALALSFVVQLPGVVVPRSRFYSMQRYNWAVHEFPWWHNCGILYSWMTLPQVWKNSEQILRDSAAGQYHVDPAGQDNTASVEYARRTHDPEGFLQTLPGSLNIQTVDIWWYKALVNGMPRAIVGLVVVLLLITALLSAYQMIILMRKGNDRLMGLQRAADPL